MLPKFINLLVADRQTAGIHTDSKNSLSAGGGGTFQIKPQSREFFTSRRQSQVVKAKQKIYSCQGEKKRELSLILRLCYWTNCRGQKIISSFNVHSSSFIVHSSTFIVQRSYFIVNHSQFIVHRSSFIDHRSQFIGFSSQFKVPCSLFIIFLIRSELSWTWFVVIFKLSKIFVT